MFRNQVGNRVKMIILDGNGVWLCHRRVNKGTFVWPTTQATGSSLTIKPRHWLFNILQQLSARRVLLSMAVGSCR
jgi:transposase